jgi:hypothetical protein
MRLRCGSSRFQQRAIVPVLRIVLSAPLYSGLYLQTTRLSRRVNTGSGFLLSRSNKFDSIPDPITDSKKMQGFLSCDRRDVVPKYSTLPRKAIKDKCHDMSPQEAFEFRLKTRPDSRTVPLAPNTPPVPVEQGLAYFVTDAELFSLDGEEIRKFIEDDYRYTVDWGDLDDNFGRNVVFQPLVPLPHMLNEQEADSSAVMHPPRRLPDQFRFFLRTIASLPQMAFYAALSFLGFLMNPVLSGIKWYGMIDGALATLTVARTTKLKAKLKCFYHRIPWLKRESGSFFLVEGFSKKHLIEILVSLQAFFDCDTRQPTTVQPSLYYRMIPFTRHRSENHIHLSFGLSRQSYMCAFTHICHSPFDTVQCVKNHSLILTLLSAVSAATSFRTPAIQSSVSGYCTPTSVKTSTFSG